MSERISWNSGKQAKARIKLLLAHVRLKKLLKQFAECHKPKVLLVGTPIHNNLGDHLLALSEESQILRAFPTYAYFEVPTEVYMLAKDILKASLSETDRVFVTGGGWMGDVWQSDDLILRDVVASFSCVCPVVILPQTIYFSNPNGEFAASCADFWRKQSNVVMCVREEASRITAIKKLGVSPERCRLLPDVGLLYRSEALDPPAPNLSRALLCLRDDREAVLSEDEREDIAFSLSAHGMTVDSATTLAGKVVSPGQRKRMVEDRISQFGQGSVVITDRLHGMVFSFLARTPCVVLDNTTGKVFGVRNRWLQNYPMVRMASNAQDAQRAALELSELPASKSHGDEAKRLQDEWDTVFQNQLEEWQ